jgi:hypothetical protein
MTPTLQFRHLGAGAAATITNLVGRALAATFSSWKISVKERWME